MIKITPELVRKAGRLDDLDLSRQAQAIAALEMDETEHLDFSALGRIEKIEAEWAKFEKSVKKEGKDDQSKLNIFERTVTTGFMGHPSRRDGTAPIQISIFGNALEVLKNKDL